MKSWSRILIFILLVAVVAGVACYVGCRLARQRGRVDAIEQHYWIHQQLQLTKEQSAKLHDIEHRFSDRKNQLDEKIRAGVQVLAEALRTDKGDSPRVRDAVKQIHQAHGELQSAVLEHVFEMKPVLTTEQYDRLLQSTADALKAAPPSK